MRRSVATLLAAALTFALSSCQTTASQKPHSGIVTTEVDLLITGGAIYDGSGGAKVVGDIAVHEEKILAVGPTGSLNIKADRTIDATGLIVAPGFIDPHTHAGSDLNSSKETRRANLPYLMQGVTTVMVGNDGDGSSAVSKLASTATARGIGTNSVYLVGLGTIRKDVMGEDDRPASISEMMTMKAMIGDAMCSGAVGFSAGLYYTPQNFASTEEVIALARVSAKFGGYYDTHIRDESDYSVGVGSALDEAIEIGRQAEMPVHVSHIKALGPSVWGKSAEMIAAVARARKDGVRVTADQYPWTASGTRISNALVPRWALDGGLDGLRKRLASPKEFARIRQEMVGNLRRRGGAEKLLITGRLGNAKVTVGKTLAEIAEAGDSDPLDAALAILREGDARVASFVMNSDDITAFAKQEWVMTGSDGSNGHPRKYASYPKAYQDFVVGQKIMSLARFVRRSSGQVADMAGLEQRGYLRQGHYADVLIFDPKTYAPVADYQNPRNLSQGVEYLLVNGKLAVERGAYTGALAGAPLLKQSDAQTRECK